jgi:predicted Fe-Mo cluster-binding NifX family protein
MKIGVPTAGDGGLDAAIADHFGRAPVFTIVDTASEAIETVENRGHHQGGSSPPPVTLAEAGAEAVLAGQIGRGAVTRFEDRGIEVYRGASGSVQEAIDAWEAGELERVGPEDVHGHGGGHGHDHGDDHDHDHGDDHDHGHGDDHGHSH